MTGWFDALVWTFPWVGLALPLPWLIRAWWPPVKEASQAAFVPFLDEVPESALRTQRAKSRWYPMAWLIWLLLVCAAAGPKWFDQPVALPVSGRDLMLAVDISGSMETKDFELSGEVVDRLTATKAIVDDFLKKRQGDRVGLILFGSQAYVQVPLTFDLHTVRTLLDEAVVGLAGKATAIGDAIGLSVKRLQHSNTSGEISSTDQVLVLLTDGVNTAGEMAPEKAAELAVKLGLKIYTVGIGADAMTVRSFFGSRQVNPSAELDEVKLTAIATITGGKYFRAHNARELANIYHEIDRLEIVEREQEIFRPQHALLMWPLALALLLSIGMMVSQLLWRRLQSDA